MYKNIIFFTCLVSFTSPCFSQTNDWLETNSVEFEKLYSLFPQPQVTGKPWAIEFKDYENFKEDTLTEGVWIGHIQSLLGSVDDYEICITQTYPFVKGTYRFLTEGSDSSGRSLVGRNGNIPILLLKYSIPKPREDVFNLAECKCYSYDLRSFPQTKRHVQMMVGKDVSADRTAFLSKSYFILRKKE